MDARSPRRSRRGARALGLAPRRRGAGEARAVRRPAARLEPQGEPHRHHRPGRAGREAPRRQPGARCRRCGARPRCSTWGAAPGSRAFRSPSPSPPSRSPAATRSAKKVAFVKAVSAELELRVRGVPARAAGEPAREGLPLAEVVVSRAFADPGAGCRWPPRYLAPGRAGARDARARGGRGGAAAAGADAGLALARRAPLRAAPVGRPARRRDLPRRLNRWSGGRRQAARSTWNTGPCPARMFHVEHFRAPRIPCQIPGAFSPRVEVEPGPHPRQPRGDMGRTVTIANQKGGVGKTTTAVNLAASLAAGEHRTLLVDLDPQGNAGSALGVARDEVEGSVYDVLLDGRPVPEVVRQHRAALPRPPPRQPPPGRRRDRAGRVGAARVAAARGARRPRATTSTSSSTAPRRSGSSP